MEGTDELTGLMPNIQRHAHAVASPGDTQALREYMLGAVAVRPMTALAPANVPRRAQLQLRKGTGREVPRRPCAIHISMADVEAERARLQGEAAQLDPEELKDALLLQAKAQRAAIVQASLRPGGKRPHVRRPFALVLDPVIIPEPEPEPELAAVTPGEGLVNGRLAHAAGSSQRGIAPASAGRSSGLWATPMEGVPERLLLATRSKVPPATASRSLGRPAHTPAGYTPLEGIPERLHLLTAQRLVLAGRTAVISNDTPGGGVDSPVEGLVHEGARRSSAVEQPAPADEFAFDFAPAVAAEEAPGGGGSSGDVGPPPPEEDDAVLSPSGAGASPARSPSAGGFPFPAGGAASPVRLLAEAGVQTGLSLKSWQSEEDGEAAEAEAAQPEAAEEGVAAEAAAAVGLAPAPLPLDGDDDDFGDGGGSLDDWGDEPSGAPDDEPAAWQQDEQPEGEEQLADWQQEEQPADWQQDEQQRGEQHPAEGGSEPEPSAAAEQRPQQRRLVRNPGVRLRNELGKRKSLVARSDVGMREVAPGLRRSTRQREEPLKWWLNEAKHYGREHTTMPTITDVQHVNPNTPWRMVADPMQSFKRKKKRAKRAPTPQELEMEAAAAAEEEEQEQAAAADSENEAGGAAAAAAADSDAEVEDQERQDVVHIEEAERPQQAAAPSGSDGSMPPLLSPPGRRVTRSHATASLPVTRSRAHVGPKGLESTGKSKRRRR